MNPGSAAKMNKTPILPELMISSAEEANSKLTNRQMRIAEIIRGENYDWSGSPTSQHSKGNSSLIREPKDSIKSMRAVLQAVNARSISFTDRTAPNTAFKSPSKTPRKVFGVDSYLERKKMLKAKKRDLSNNSSVGEGLTEQSTALIHQSQEKTFSKQRNSTLINSITPLSP
jgi:hypothetical protein